MPSEYLLADDWDFGVILLDVSWWDCGLTSYWNPINPDSDWAFRHSNLAIPRGNCPWLCGLCGWLNTEGYSFNIEEAWRTLVSSGRCLKVPGPVITNCFFVLNRTIPGSTWGSRFEQLSFEVSSHSAAYTILTYGYLCAIDQEPARINGRFSHREGILLTIWWSLIDSSLASGVINGDCWKKSSVFLVRWWFSHVSMARLWWVFFSQVGLPEFDSTTCVWGGVVRRQPPNAPNFGDFQRSKADPAGQAQLEQQLWWDGVFCQTLKRKSVLQDQHGFFWYLQNLDTPFIH